MTPKWWQPFGDTKTAYNTYATEKENVHRRQPHLITQNEYGSKGGGAI